MMEAHEFREIVRAAIPEGAVVTAHNEKGHFYTVRDAYVRDVLKKESVTYPSVTGKLGLLKDPSIKNFEVNRAMDYIFAHYKEFSDDNVMAHLETASKAGIVERDNAGHIGTDIHESREKYFWQWIETGQRPKDIMSFIPEDKFGDIRIKSALRALNTFIDDYGYIPVLCELFVYSHKYETAGTLDDLGILRWPIRQGDPECDHNNADLFGGSSKFLIYNAEKNIGHCPKCDYKYRMVFAITDVKTSNQFKDHYFLQVAMYYDFLKKLVPGLKIDKAFILKLSKENGTYKIEDLESPSQIAGYARSMLRTTRGMEIIRNRRRDNQKNVLEI